jgi:predicted solute-binding protein
MEQSTKSNKEKNKMYITRYKDKNPIRYNEILQQAKRKYYQKNKEKIMEASRLYRKIKKAEFQLLKTFYFYDESKFQNNPEEIN